MKQRKSEKLQLYQCSIHNIFPQGFTRNKNKKPFEIFVYKVENKIEKIFLNLRRKILN